MRLKSKRQIRKQLECYKEQNAQLWQLLDANNIEVPKAIIDRAEIDMLGYDAKILLELEKLHIRIRVLEDLLFTLISKQAMESTAVKEQQNEPAE